jgi:hypothetical protein
MTTTSDLGYTFWQSLNSDEDWEEKVMDLNLKYKCNTKWMSDRKEIPMEDRADTDPGMEAYKKCLEWARELKQMNETKEYRKLQVKCNEKAAQLGYFKEWGKVADATSSKVADKDYDSLEDMDEGGEFELEEMDGIPKVEV